MTLTKISPSWGKWAMLAFLCATSSSALSALAINWGGNGYVTANQNFASQGGFVGGSPVQINPTVGYSTSATSAIFHGAIETFSGSSEQLSTINNDGNGDLISLKSQDTVNNTGFLILWKQADFLNSLNTGNVGFSSSGAVTLTTTSYVQQTTDSGRLVIKSGGNYYISNRVFSAGSTTFSPTPATLSWFSYNPAAGINVEGASLSPATILNNGSITNVTEVGFYFEASGTASNPNAVRIRAFSAEMESIPEPSVLGLLGLVGSLCLLRKRK